MPQMCDWIYFNRKSFNHSKNFKLFLQYIAGHCHFGKCSAYSLSDFQKKFTEYNLPSFLLHLSILATFQPTYMMCLSLFHSSLDEISKKKKNTSYIIFSNVTFSATPCRLHIIDRYVNLNELYADRKFHCKLSKPSC